MKKESWILVFLSIILILVAWYPSSYFDYSIQLTSVRVILALMLGFYIFYKSDKILKIDGPKDKFLLQFLMFFALIHIIIMVLMCMRYILIRYLVFTRGPSIW